MFLAILSLMPFAIIAGFIALVLFRRDLHTVSIIIIIIMISYICIYTDSIHARDLYVSFVYRLHFLVDLRSMSV